MLTSERAAFKIIKDQLANKGKGEVILNVEDIPFYQERCVTLNTLEDYQALIGGIDGLFPAVYKAVCRHLCRTDLFFLLVWGLSRVDAMHPWLMARCKEVQSEPDGCLDLWARDHYKSTIITFALPIQDILSSHGDNPLAKWDGKQPTNCILSCTRPIAKSFLRQIKREFEANERLKELFPDILWSNPDKEAPKWSEDDGIIVKRKSNPKESTLEAWGLIEGQPTSKHFDILTYDDVVTQGSVGTPEMIQKTVRSWEMSVNLGTRNTRRRAVGTIYHFNDAYRQFIKRGTMKVRVYACTTNSEVLGEPVLKTKAQIAESYKLMGPQVFASQMLLNPIADDIAAFDAKDLQYHANASADGLNLYLLCDPANQKKKGSDFTVMMIIGLGADQNIYIKDIIRDRLNLSERCDALFNLHAKWMPLAVGYEQMGMQGDIQHIEDVQNRKNYRFKILPLHQSLQKNERIKKLQPLFAEQRIFLPRRCLKTNYEGVMEDLTQAFIEEEFRAYPVAVHDDMLDALAMIRHPDLWKASGGKMVFPNANNRIVATSFLNRGGVL